MQINISTYKSEGNTEDIFTTLFCHVKSSHLTLVIFPYRPINISFSISLAQELTDNVQTHTCHRQHTGITEPKVETRAFSAPAPSANSLDCY